MSAGYSHAQPGERCTKCNDLAARIVGSKALCVDHFDALVGSIAQRVRWRMLTPPTTPEGADAWRSLLDHGVYIGAITDDDARQALGSWQEVRDAA